MEIKILGCYGAELPDFKTTCFMVDQKILIDAGAVTSVLSQEEQAGISDVLVTHAHLDHIKDIPLLADNVINASGYNSNSVNIISSKEVIETLSTHLFNGKIWPDFTTIPTPDNPVLRYKEITPGESFTVNDLTVTAVEVKHTVPTLGYIIEGDTGSFAISGDTCITDKFWEKINETEGMKAVFLEVSFPNNMEELANISGHLTPEMVGSEIEKLDNKELPVYLYHMKPNFLGLLKKEISDIDRSDLSLLNLNDTITI